MYDDDYNPIFDIETAEDAAVGYVREAMYRILNNFRADIKYSAERGEQSVSRMVPIDFVESVARIYLSKGYQVECLGEGRHNKEEVLISWEGLHG